MVLTYRNCSPLCVCLPSSVAGHIKGKEGNLLFYDLLLFCRDHSYGDEICNN